MIVTNMILASIFLVLAKLVITISKIVIHVHFKVDLIEKTSEIEIRQAIKDADENEMWG